MKLSNNNQLPAVRQSAPGPASDHEGSKSSAPREASDGIDPSAGRPSGQAQSTHHALVAPQASSQRIAPPSFATLPLELRSMVFKALRSRPLAEKLALRLVSRSFRENSRLDQR